MGVPIATSTCRPTRWPGTTSSAARASLQGIHVRSAHFSRIFFPYLHGHEGGGYPLRVPWEEEKPGTHRPSGTGLRSEGPVLTSTWPLAHFQPTAVRKAGEASSPTGACSFRGSVYPGDTRR